MSDDFNEKVIISFPYPKWKMDLILYYKNLYNWTWEEFLDLFNDLLTALFCGINNKTQKAYDNYVDALIDVWSDNLSMKILDKDLPNNDIQKMRQIVKNKQKNIFLVSR